MTGSHFFYQLLIKPLEILFEVVYRYAMIYVDNSGIAIILQFGLQQIWLFSSLPIWTPIAILACIFSYAGKKAE